MDIKACVFDIDGTLLPGGQQALNARVKAALRALQQKGVAVLVASGRAPFAARVALGGFVPDYLIACTGGLVEDKTGAHVYEDCMTTQEMYALVDYCEDYEVPLNFVFDDGYYVYVEYQRMRETGTGAPGTLAFLKDGEDQKKHLEHMPYAGCVYAAPRQIAGFQKKYGHLGLRFLPFSSRGDRFDVVRGDMDKARTVAWALERLGTDWAHTAAFGDGENDEQLLDKAALPVAMANGCGFLQKPGRLVAPPCAEDGAVQVIEKYLL